MLPTTPKFKGDLTARYTFALGQGFAGNLQVSEVYVGARWADLRILARDELGQMPSYALTDLTFGVEKGGLYADLYVNNTFDKRAVLSRYAACDIDSCGQIAVYDLPTIPRLIGIKFGQKF
jgi:outer membrane receptor protein involved in Fe transport